MSSSCVSHQVIEYCGSREKTIHTYTTDKIFRCCGEKVPAHLYQTIATTKQQNPVKNEKGKGKQQEPIIISSPVNTPTKRVLVKSGQFTERQTVELYRKGSILKDAIEKKLKEDSNYGLITSLSVPMTKNIQKPTSSRDSRKIVVFVGSSSDKWSLFKNLGKYSTFISEVMLKGY